MIKDFVSADQFARLESSYGKKWGVGLVLFSSRGEAVRGRIAADTDSLELRDTVAKQILEAIRWGEAPFILLKNGSMLWLVPVMINTAALGCVAAILPGWRLALGGDPELLAAVRDAAEELRECLEKENITNSALLEHNRAQTLRERRHAEAIHEFKSFTFDFRLIYIREEPRLMNAIRRGDREEARGILNQILVILFHQAGENLGLVKSFILEILTMMCRTAVETGCDACHVFGRNYGDFAKLADIENDYEFSPWLHEIMERLIDVIHDNRKKSMLPQIQRAVDFMRNHLGEDLNRDLVARTAHMSPSHFSRLFRSVFGENFSDVLNRFRIERAAELLSGTDKSLCAIALECGFKDQSYFTKVFRKYNHKTPGEYRQRLAQDREESARIRRESARLQCI